MAIFGPDISSFEAGLDLSRLSAASFVIAKTTEGTYYTDADYQGWRRQAAQLGKPFAWYHFLTTEDVQAQIQHLLANVGDPSLPGMLDVEPQTQTGSKPGLAQVLAFADAAVRVGLNLRLAYIPRWYWQEWGSPDLSGLGTRGLRVVASAYPGGSGSPSTLYPGDQASGWAAYGGQTPLLYQYTNQAADGGKTMDYNAFRGTAAQLAAYLGAPTTGGTVSLDATDLHNMYNYGEEDITLPSGTIIHKAPLGWLAHGAWVSTNDAKNGLVLLALARIEADVKALAAPTQPQPMDPDALATAIVAKLPAHVALDPATIDAIASATETMAEQHNLGGMSAASMATALGAAAASLKAGA